MSFNDNFIALRAELTRAERYKQIYDGAMALLGDMDETAAEHARLVDVAQHASESLGPCIAEMKEIIALVDMAYTTAVNTAVQADAREVNEPPLQPPGSTITS